MTKLSYLYAIFSIFLLGLYYLNSIHHCDRNPLDTILRILLDDRQMFRYFARNGKYESLQCLIEEGFDVNYADSDDQTALGEAASQGHEEIVRLLIRR